MALVVVEGLVRSSQNLNLLHCVLRALRLLERCAEGGQSATTPDLDFCALVGLHEDFIMHVACRRAGFEPLPRDDARCIVEGAGSRVLDGTNLISTARRA